MKKGFLCLLLPVLLHAQPSHVISISNNSALPFTAQVVEVPWSAVIAAWPLIDTADFLVTDAASGRQLMFQLEHHGEKKIRNLLVQTTIPANGTVKLFLKKGHPMPFAPKTYCRYVPERKDDFAWENDKIAFRMYGKALETTNENAYGLDVWVKRTDKLVLDIRYKLDDYHKDHGDGLDNYDVGFSLGAGNIAPFGSDSVWYSKNYHRWRILDNGPLRSSFQLIYDPWIVQGDSVQVTKTIRLDAGSQLNFITANYVYGAHKPLPFVIGLVKRKKPGEILLDEQHGTAGYWEPADSLNGTTGTGCFVPGAHRMVMSDKQILLFGDTNAEGEISYYAGAAWDRATEIRSSAEWFRYLGEARERQLHPLTVTVQ